MDANSYMSESVGFGDFLSVQVSHTKTTVITVLDIFTNAMKLFQDDVCKMKKYVELQNING